MSLPNADPSLPSDPAPIFQDNEFVRGDQLRANNQAIWGDLEYLRTGSLTEDFLTKLLTSAGLITANGGLSVEKFIKYLTGGVAKAFTYMDTDGSLSGYINAELVGGLVKLKATGTAFRFRIDATAVNMTLDKYTGTAGDTATWTPVFTVRGSDGNAAFATTNKSTLPGIDLKQLSLIAAGNFINMGLNAYYDGSVFRSFVGNVGSAVLAFTKPSGASSINPVLQTYIYNNSTAADQALTGLRTMSIPICNENVRIMTLTGTFDAGSFVLALPHGLTNLVSSNKTRGLLMGIYDIAGIVFSSPYVAGVNYVPTYGTVDNTNVNIYRGATGITRTGWAILFYVD